MIGLYSQRNIYMYLKNEKNLLFLIITKYDVDKSKKLIPYVVFIKENSRKIYPDDTQKNTVFLR